MPALITRQEAFELGELSDHGEIEALIERAWHARVERFGNSTDMCSLVNAKSGGCAEDCGFCAQSRHADADTPMHAMMEPEQMLEHARAAEAAGAHRFCMVAQGQGLSRRDFEKILAGARLVAEHTNLKRCAAIGDISGGRGGVMDLGETAEQRVEMAFELAAINPTSVPINLLIPREGTKFGERELMDPWEAVKWVAIFRLIIPDALFRLCGGRIENLGELAPLAVRAGLNGVMMGNFLTALGATPAEDRAMFEQQGLNIARQPDNGGNPRPDNRSGWLAGDTPDVVERYL